MKREEPLKNLKGVGPKTAALFEKAQILSIGNLMEFYPGKYDAMEEISEPDQLKEDTVAAVYGSIQQPVSVRHIRGLTISGTEIQSNGQTLGVRWFNMPYLSNTLRAGQSYVFRGRVTRKGSLLFLEQPAMYDASHYQELRKCLQPIYKLPSGITNNQFRKLLRQALNDPETKEETLPEVIRNRYNLSSYGFAIEQIHFPKDYHELMLARERLVFEEFLFFILMVRNLKQHTDQWTNGFQIRESSLVKKFLSGLNFELTGAQKRTWEQISKDLECSKSMSRLVQGDVGSGKTVIAFLALLKTAESGYQSALMAPTEVLAKQHFEEFREKWMEIGGKDAECALLVGSTSAKEKRTIYKGLKSGTIKVVIGTHAVFQDKVEFFNLALVVTDEQHRFGVKQREKLSEKGDHPHILVMSATPIPRTLAVILYGDLDISVIDELPARRLPVKNCVVGTEYRPTAYKFMEKEVLAGHQIYIICPMVEESEVIEAENVLEYTQRLRSTSLKKFSIECLHGKMKPKEKNELMERFAEGKIQILVSTTVIEVGINVPNATVMMVENAERFGLAQLHQLRGRVGRGKDQSYCIFMYGNNSRNVKERLEVLNKSNDGFEIASKDMQMRGPGDLFGVRQSGDLDFRVGDIIQDARILESASAAAEWITEDEHWRENPFYVSLVRKIEDKNSHSNGNINL